MTTFQEHKDDLAVDRFALQMKAKLKRAREKDRAGWDDKANCSDEHLADLLLGHLEKTNEGNFLDLANFAMMLHERNASPDVIASRLMQKL